MTRVTFIAGTYQPTQCGVADYTYHLRQSLADLGVRSTVITTHTAAQPPDIIGAVPGWRMTDLLPLVRSLHRTPTDLLHVQHAAGTYGFERAIFLLPWLLKATGWRKPIVTTVHEYGWWEWQPSWVPPKLLEGLKQWGQARGWWDREDGGLLTQSDAIITTHSEVDTVLQERLPWLHDRIQRLPIAPNISVAEIDRTTARQALRQQYHWPEDSEVIVFFGFLHPVKGLETLLHAFQAVVAARPNARLLFLGGVESLALPKAEADRYWQHLHTLVQTLGLTQTVELTGYLDGETASRCLAGADVGVLPFHPGVTLKSGSLLTLLAHRLPVVATDANPPDPELAQAQVVRSVPPRDAAKLTIALLALLNHPEQRHQLGTAGHTFGQQFGWTAIAQAHAQIYQTVCSQSQIKRPHALTKDA